MDVDVAPRMLAHDVDRALLVLHISCPHPNQQSAVIELLLHYLREQVMHIVITNPLGQKRTDEASGAIALTTPTGTLVSYIFINRIDPSLLVMLLALSAGALIYVAATHLLPRAECERHRFSLLALAAGMPVALVIVMSKS